MEDITTVDREVSAANEVLDQIEKSIPKSCWKIMIAGNHEARYEKFYVNKARNPEFERIRKFSNWYTEYGLDKRKWTHVEYGQAVHIGKIVFSHGWYTGPNAAKQMSACFPGRNVIFGHSHNHLNYTCTDERGLPIASESIGTLSRFDLSYLKGKPPISWIHMFEYIDMDTDGSFSKHPVYIIDGKFIEYGKKFGS